MFSFSKFILIISILSFTLYPISVNAQIDSRGIIINPSLQEIQVDKGKDYSYDISLENDTEDRDFTVSFIKQSFESGENEGEPKIKEFDVTDVSSNWVGTPEPVFQLKPKSKKTVPIKISIPADAQPGSYYYALTFEAKNDMVPENVNFFIKQRIVSLLFLQVSGQVKREATFSNLTSNISIVDPFFDNLEFTFKINATGNSYLKPSGNIYVYSNPDQPINIIDLNPARKILFPNTSRQFSRISKANIQVPIISSGLNENYLQKLVDIDRPWFGKRTIDLSMTYSNSDSQLVKTKSTLDVWFIPWKTLTLSFIPIVLITIIFLTFRKYGKR